jgi:putative PIN family toxin of toxin-antitoxin system
VITAVLDANVLASGAVAPPGGTLATVIDAFLTERFTGVMSEPIDSELERTLANAYFARRLTPELRARYLAEVRRTAVLIPITVVVNGIATHPEDDLVLATAVSAGCHYLVTGDIPFRARVPHFRDVTILRAREFVEVLRREGVII